MSDVVAWSLIILCLAIIVVIIVAIALALILGKKSSEWFDYKIESTRNLEYNILVF